jgi:hypothetical protein
VSEVVKLVYNSPVMATCDGREQLQQHEAIRQNMLMMSMGRSRFRHHDITFKTRAAFRVTLLGGRQSLVIRPPIVLTDATFI